MDLIKEIKTNFHRPLRAKLIFNPGSGQPGESPQQLVSILSEMQNQNIVPEVYITHPKSKLEEVVHAAIKSGIKLIVVAGGDGTIDSVVGAMVGSDATLGIIPTGTRNNVAFNLGITGDLASSVALLRRGYRLKIDVGRVHCGHARRWFLEGVALGLISDLYPMADGIQHGDLAQLGGLLTTLISATPSNLRINLNDEEYFDATTHMMLIANMAFIGPHFQVSPDVSFRDSHLDVFLFSDMSKLAMISYVVLSPGGLPEDAGHQYYRAQHVKVNSDPKMSVLADGVLVGEGSFSVHIHPRTLKVMAGKEHTGHSVTKIVSEPSLVLNES
jgi:YegS/Rv2252/BmrU family lipid kinase